MSDTIPKDDRPGTRHERERKTYYLRPDVIEIVRQLAFYKDATQSGILELLVMREGKKILDAHLASMEQRT